MKAYNLETARLHQDRITGLYLHGLGLTEWPSIIFELPHLEILCLSDNRLREVPEATGLLSCLRELDMSGNQLQALPGALEKLSGLAEVNLSRNQFSRFPNALTKLPALRLLDMGFNRLRSLPTHMSAAGMQVLRLHNNQINRLPDWLWMQVDMQTLNLENNKLEEIPVSLGGLRSLEYLNLARNRIKELPGTLGELSRLAELDVHRNVLESLPATIGRLHSLRRLFLDFNRLASLPEQLESLRSLRAMSCQGNQLTAWPGYLGKTPHLETLELGRNRIGALPESLGAWPALERLGLENNAFSDLPADLARLPRLRELHLGRNHFSHFPEALIAAPALEKVSGVAGASRALRFMQACRRAEVPEGCCKALFQCWQGKAAANSVPAEILLQGLRLPLPSLRRELLTVLMETSDKPVVPGISAIGFLGKTRLPRAQWKERLEMMGISASEPTGQIPTHVVLGTGALELPAAWLTEGVVFMEEAALHQQLQAKSPAYLEEMEDHSQLGILLQSRQEASLRLSVALMKSGGVPRALMTDLYLAWKTVADPKLKKALRDLLVLHCLESDRKFLEQAKTFSSLSQLEEYCLNTAFDAIRIWRWQEGG